MDPVFIIRRSSGPNLEGLAVTKIPLVLRIKCRRRKFDGNDHNQQCSDGKYGERRRGVRNTPVLDGCDSGQEEWIPLAA